MIDSNEKSLPSVITWHTPHQSDKTGIQIKDAMSGMLIAEVEMTSDQLVSMLKKTGNVPCEVYYTKRIDRIGKKRVHIVEHEKLPDAITDYDERVGIAITTVSYTHLTLPTKRIV